MGFEVQRDVGAGAGLFLLSLTFAAALLPKCNRQLARPFFDGRGESLANYARGVELRGQVAYLDPAKRASALILHVDTVA